MSYKAKGIKEMGSVKSIETSLDYELGGEAGVRYKLTFNNGESSSKEIGLIKINNTWYMYKF